MFFFQSKWLVCLSPLSIVWGGSLTALCTEGNHSPLSVLRGVTHLSLYWRGSLASLCNEGGHSPISVVLGGSLTSLCSLMTSAEWLAGLCAEGEPGGSPPSACFCISRATFTASSFSTAKLDFWARNSSSCCLFRLRISYKYIYDFCNNEFTTAPPSA